MAQTTLRNYERTFLTLLKARQVKYLVIGGYAVAYHGYLRAIEDLDVWVATDRQNAQALATVLHDFGDGLPVAAERFFELPERVIRIGAPPFLIERFHAEDRFIHLGLQPPQVEIMTSISGLAFDPCYAERVEDYLDGVWVNLISLACLKANKKASIRPKDADDYEHLNR